MANGEKRGGGEPTNRTDMGIEKLTRKTRLLVNLNALKAALALASASALALALVSALSPSTKSEPKNGGGTRSSSLLLLSLSSSYVNAKDGGAPCASCAS